MKGLLCTSTLLCKKKLVNYKESGNLSELINIIKQQSLIMASTLTHLYPHSYINQPTHVMKFETTNRPSPTKSS